jgi:hypothetical protein
LLAGLSKEICVMHECAATHVHSYISPLSMYYLPLGQLAHWNPDGPTIHLHAEYMHAVYLLPSYCARGRRRPSHLSVDRRHMSLPPERLCSTFITDSSVSLKMAGHLHVASKHNDLLRQELLQTACMIACILYAHLGHSDVSHKQHISKLRVAGLELSHFGG